jgi:SPFH domain/Band 7 family protein
MRKKLSVALLLFTATLGLSACAIAPPDRVGLYYMEGSIDGYHFDHCIEPGVSDDGTWNNSVVYLPTNLRTWNIAPTGGDTDHPIVVASKPEPNQPSGVQVNVWSQVNLVLNTNCDGGKNSTVVQFWEKIGRRYEADNDKGWRNMLLNTVVPALEKATRVVIRNYSADPLVAGTNLPEIQEAIGKEFSAELLRVTGAPFFCGPDFNRATKTCTPVQVLVKDIDYSDPGIQQARNEKQKALEQAQALVAEAEGKLRAANAQQRLYDNPAWVQLEKARIQLEIARSCGQNPNCHMIMGADGTIITTG